ncbi:MerR family transcriptional regulator [Ruegeria sp. HKCCD8929]|uniref:MerR family transcriptional regulator n=1 Tax=Ruegeria sp. HKCCD8929 TaxID=2683006 RepID=UPI001488F5CC|nr:MerR family transcriptional regulator [Ruegeria sp. HKCCD8929]
MSKSPEAFRTISEVAEWLGVQAHVLRFWESRFSQVKPVKRAGGRRYYRPSDMQLLGGIKKLLHDDGITIKGVQKMLREQGVANVAALSQGLNETATPDAAESGTVVKLTGQRPAVDTSTQIDMDLGEPAEDVKMPTASEPPEFLAEQNAADHPDESGMPEPVAATEAVSDTESPGPEAAHIAPGPLTHVWTAERFDPALLRQIAPIAQDLRAWLERVQTQAAG